ncbi:MAG: lysylphosphatidylglycerol synthase transmembrane domain-containing protein [Actinomycetota bacterium]|nr:lysylphosphatidylglycerol synthase transmembrane domain-containing protein [Actinomycetota bacterium]
MSIIKKIKAFYRKRKKIINITLRLVISLGLILFLIFSQFKDFKTISSTLKNLNILLIILSFLTHAYGIWITAYRWQTLLKTQNVSTSIPFLSGSVLVGMFFNNFLPTSIGGDVYRAYDVTKKTGFPMSSSVSVIVIERLSGIIASGLFAIAALFLGFTTIGGKSIVIPIIIFVVISLILFFLILNPNILGLKKLARKIKFLSKLFEKLKNVYETFLSFKKYKWVLVKVMFYSITLQFAVILNYWLAARALGIELSLTAFIFIVPVVTIIAMLPISLGGIGVREGSLVLMMVSLGAQNEKAAMCSLLLFAMLVIIAIIGGIIYGTRPIIEKKEKDKIL